MTRRDALRLLPVAVSFSFPRQNNTPKPFKVDIPQATVSRILARVRDTRLPDRLDSSDWRYGANWNYMKSLAEYWVSHFDWKKDQLLTNVMIYLVTDTVATAVWFYRGALDDPAAPTRGKLQTPAGFASFPGEMPSLNPPRSILQRNLNLVHYTKMARGGHFACLEQPKLFVDDVRSFFRKVRG